MEICVVEMEELRVLGLEHVGPYYKIGEAFERLHGFQLSAHVENAPLVAIYYDDPHNVPEHNLRSLAGVIVQPTAQISIPDLTEEKIPGGRYAMTSFSGPYSGLPNAWEDFYGSIFSQGHKTKPDLCYERYINTMGEVPPEQLITELYAPLA